MSGAIQVLVVDDDPKFRRFAAQGLEESGYQARTASGVAAAREALAERTPDIVLLDVMMPDADGRQLLSDLRRAGDDVPVIFVTARGATSERVEGLQLGADDYIVKPFTFAELIARIEAVVRRRRGVLQLEFGSLEIDVARRTATCNGKDVAFSLKELDLLTALVRARGEVLSRTEILRDVWGTTHDPGTNVIEVHVGRVRRKLELVDGPRIETVRGRGYRIEADS